MPTKQNLNSLENSSIKYIETYTTRVDTIYGVTCLVLAPEHPLVSDLTKPEHKSRVVQYIDQSRKKTDLERTDLNKHKTGVFTGSYVKNPLTGDKIPVWVADYVLSTYGTGAVMSVPAHDDRDFEFSKKYDLGFKKIIEPQTENLSKTEEDSVFTEDGILVNSGEFSGLTSSEARKSITNHLEAKNLGVERTNYKLRDWLVSRQRYWGAPIPIIYTPYEKLVEYNSGKLFKNSPSKNSLKLFFGSVNPGKIKRLRRIIKDLDVELVTINDLDFEIKVPAETGQSVVENAQIKAKYYWDNLREKMPVLSEDVGMELKNIQDQTKNPGKNLKRDVKNALGASSDQNMIQYYKDLAEVNGGFIDQILEYGYSIYDGNKFSDELVQVKNRLTSIVGPKYTEGYPLDSVILVETKNGWKYASELDEVEIYEYWEKPLQISLTRLVQGFKYNSNSIDNLLKPQVVIVHGGSSFKNDTELETWQKEQPSEVEFTHKFKTDLDSGKYAWYHSVKESLESCGYKVDYVQMPNSINAKYVEWKQEFEQLVSSLTTESHLVGHSLGGLFLAKYLSEIKLQIKALHLVSPSWDEGDFTPPEDWNIIEKNCENIYIWHSTNDSVVPFNEALKYQQFLPKSILFKFNEKAHFNQPDFPELVDFIQTSEQNSWTSFSGKKFRLIIDSNLPVLLPKDVDFRPDGQSPLHYSQTFKQVVCPLTGFSDKDGVFREKDTMDTFVCSSWYYLRYLNTENNHIFGNRDRVNNWMPLDIYVGGAEHAVLHLLYARFFYKALKDGWLAI